MLNIAIYFHTSFILSGASFTFIIKIVSIKFFDSLEFAHDLAHSCENSLRAVFYTADQITPMNRLYSLQWYPQNEAHFLRSNYCSNEKWVCPHFYLFETVRVMFEEIILLGKYLKINFIATDKRRNILKINDASVFGRSLFFSTKHFSKK